MLSKQHQTRLVCISTFQVLHATCLHPAAAPQVTITSSTLNFDHLRLDLLTGELASSDQLWCHNITCQRLELSHSQPLAQRDKWHGPAHSHRHTICHRSTVYTLCAQAAARALEHRHANTFHFPRDSVKMDKVIASQTACLERSALSLDGQAGRTDVMEEAGGNNKSAFAWIMLDCSACQR